MGTSNNDNTAVMILTNIEPDYVPSTALSTLPFLILTVITRGKYYYHLPHFSEEETESDLLIWVCIHSFLGGPLSISTPNLFSQVAAL